MRKGIAPLVLAGVIAGGSLTTYFGAQYVGKGVKVVAVKTAHVVSHLIQHPKKHKKGK